mmetsp:Transcript_31952/g.51612  ORF Transcript_31952/g.51612 Transcript_31952/m.51612 type:complete len:205 (+) Transcript_31952:1566-2180(+)
MLLLSEGEGNLNVENCGATPRMEDVGGTMPDEGEGSGTETGASIGLSTIGAGGCAVGVAVTGGSVGVAAATSERAAWRDKEDGWYWRRRSALPAVSPTLARVVEASLFKALMCFPAIFTEGMIYSPVSLTRCVKFCGEAEFPSFSKCRNTSQNVDLGANCACKRSPLSSCKAIITLVLGVIMCFGVDFRDMRSSCAVKDLQRDG